MTEGIVKCDMCQWNQPTKNVESWHKKLCPKCGKSEIINEDDMEILEAVSKLREIGVILPSNTRRKKDVISMSLDTAGLRNRRKRHTRI